MQVGCFKLRTGVKTINWLTWNLPATEYLLHKNAMNKREKRRFDPDHDEGARGFAGIESTFQEIINGPSPIKEPEFSAS